MTAQEILAKVTGLESRFTNLEADKVALQSELKAESNSRKTLEASLAVAQAELAKIRAAAPPAKEDGEEEKTVTDAIKALENAITVLKGIAGQGEAPAEGDDEAKAEGDSDMSDDMEAKKEASAKNWKNVLAIRNKQFSRKQLFASKRTVTTAKVEKMVVDRIAALGITTPLALNKDGKNPLRAQKPDGGKRATALVRNGFNEQPAVAALNQMLGRK